MRRCCVNALPGRPGTRNKDSPDEYSLKEGPLPEVSVCNVEAVTQKASTRQRVPGVAFVKDKCPAVCKLMLRQATTARKTRYCRLGERSFIGILRAVLSPHFPLHDTRQERRNKTEISMSLPSAKNRCSGFCGPCQKNLYLKDQPPFMARCTTLTAFSVIAMLTALRGDLWFGLCDCNSR
jgi:hypothetical protein